MIIDEHCLCTGPGPHIYLTGDDDNESPDVRLAFISNGLALHFDLPLKRLRELNNMITEVLDEEGICPHGNITDFCGICINEAENRC